MGIEKGILRTIPVIHSAALVENAYGLVKKKKKKSKHFLQGATDTIIGSSMIAEESKFIEGFTWDYFS